MTDSVKGRIHSFQSLGAVDGPGIRFVAFMQGCNLRCGCCHNPDTWNADAGEIFTPEQVVEKALRFKEYFGSKGGVTVSGGEPLLQADFVKQTFVLCRKNGLNTCLDTSGSVLNDDVKGLLNYTDRVLLDIKYTDPNYYIKYVGCKMESVLKFLEYTCERKLKVTLRQVIITGINDNEENIEKLNFLAERFNNVDKIELLPFEKICQTKYENMNIPFAFKDIPEPSPEVMRRLNSFIKKKYLEEYKTI